MNKLSDVGIVLSHTARSRAYLRALIRSNIQLSFAVILGEQGSRVNAVALPNNIHAAQEKKSSPRVPDCWSEVEFDECESIIEMLQELGISFKVIESMDINSEQVINFLNSRTERVFIYSGYPGAILKKEVLSSEKKFLHIHGGFLPDFKGSTTNYYSILEEGSMGASAIFLNEKIDSGPILLRVKFPVPKNKIDIDAIYDSAARAKVLINVLKIYIERGNWDFQLKENRFGETFYVIHPVLKHIAILGK